MSDDRKDERTHTLDKCRPELSSNRIPLFFLLYSLTNQRSIGQTTSTFARITLEKAAEKQLRELKIDIAQARKLVAELGPVQASTVLGQSSTNQSYVEQASAEVVQDSADNVSNLQGKVDVLAAIKKNKEDV